MGGLGEGQGRSAASAESSSSGTQSEVQGNQGSCLPEPTTGALVTHVREMNGHA